MAKNLLLLSLYFENKTYEAQSKQLLKNVIDDVKKSTGILQQLGPADGFAIKASLMKLR